MSSNEKNKASTGSSAEKALAHNSASALEKAEGTQANTAKPLDEGHQALSTSTDSEQHNGDASVGDIFVNPSMPVLLTLSCSAFECPQSIGSGGFSLLLDQCASTSVSVR